MITNWSIVWVLHCIIVFYFSLFNTIIVWWEDHEEGHFLVKRLLLLQAYTDDLLDSIFSVVAMKQYCVYSAYFITEQLASKFSSE